MAVILSREPAEVQKVRQPGNLVARKFLKNQALAEIFLIFLPHFLTIKQFGACAKGMIIVFLQKGHNYNFQQKLSVCLVFHCYFLLFLSKWFLPAAILIQNFPFWYKISVSQSTLKICHRQDSNYFSLLADIILKFSASCNSNSKIFYKLY